MEALVTQTSVGDQVASVPSLFFAFCFAGFASLFQGCVNGLGLALRLWPHANQRLGLRETRTSGKHMCSWLKLRSRQLLASVLDLGYAVFIKQG